MLPRAGTRKKGKNQYAYGLFLHSKPVLNDTLLSWSLRVAVTEYHRLRGLNNKYLLLKILEAGKSKVKAWQM